MAAYDPNNIFAKIAWMGGGKANPPDSRDLTYGHQQLRKGLFQASPPTSFPSWVTI